MAPERLAAFESALAGGGAWRCVPPGGRVEATLPAASLNDDYCDCNDGSDEPGTSACAGSGGGGGGEAGGFHCASGLALGGGAHVAASRVDDGVCDCCDGSDERDGACADRCTEMRKGERERDAGRRRGAARKATYETMAIEQPALLKVGAVELRAMLTTCHLPPTTYHLPLTTNHLPLTTYHLLLTTYHLLLTTYHLLQVGAVDLRAMPAFGALGGKCLKSEQGEYEYEVCPFRSASQKKRGGGRSFSLGSQWRWEHLPSHIHSNPNPNSNSEPQP